MNQTKKDNIDGLIDNEQQVDTVKTNKFNNNKNNQMQSKSKDEVFTNELNTYLELLNGSTASYVLGYN